MPFNIETAENQQYSTVSLEPQVQTWDIPFGTSVAYFPGYAYPDVLSIPVQIKDFLAEDTQNLYSEFRIRAELEYQNSNGSPLSQNFAQIAGPITPGQNYVLTPNNLNVTIDVNFQDLELLDAQDVSNKKTLVIVLRVYGVRVLDGVEVPISVYDGGVNSTFVNVLLIDEDNYYIETENNAPAEFNHVLGEALPSPLRLNVYGVGTFFILVPKYFDILPHPNLTGPLPLLSEEEWNGYRIDIDAAPLAVQIQPNITIENINETEYDNGLAVLTPTMYAANWDTPNTDYNKTIRVNVYKTGGAKFNPNSLEYFAVKNVTEASQIALEIFSPGNWTFQTPSWMLNPAPTGNGYDSLYNLKPIHSSNFTPGVYEGQCVLTNEDNETYIVPVRHTVVDTLDSGFSESGINFTRDNLLSTNIYHTNQNNICHLLAKIGGLSYTEGFYDVNEYEYKTGFFKTKASLHIGEIVERNVNRLKGEDVFNLLGSTFIMNSNSLSLIENPNGDFAKVNYYAPIAIDLDFTIQNKNNSNIVFNENHYSNIKWLRGRKPKSFQYNSAILVAKPRDIRITPKSKLILNALIGKASYNLSVLINGVEIYSFNELTQGKKTFGFLFKNLPIKPGDVVDVKVLPFSLNTATQVEEVLNQRYLVFPEGKYSSHIIYEDEYGMPQIFELTGDFTFESEYNFTEVESTEDLVRAVRNLQSKNNQKFSINTGFIPKSNQTIIDDIIRSGTAWLIGNETEVLVELRPVSKKMTNSSSDAETYAYDIEFEINPTHDLQVYS